VDGPRAARAPPARGAAVGLFLVIIGTVDDVVRPLLTRRGLQLHPLLVRWRATANLATERSIALREFSATETIDRHSLSCLIDNITNGVHLHCRRRVSSLN
jgi:hypothetical protein